MFLLSGIFYLQQNFYVYDRTINNKTIKAIIKNEKSKDLFFLAPITSKSSYHTPDHHNHSEQKSPTETGDLNNLYDKSSLSAVTEKSTKKHQKKFSGLSFKNSENVHVVNHTGAFLERLGHYNDAISRVRKKFFEGRGSFLWKDVVEAGKLKVLWGKSDDFLEELSAFPHLSLVVLPWLATSVSSNVLQENYFEWTGSDQLCGWIETEAFTKARWDAVYNKKCNRNASHSILPSTLETMYLYAKPINPSHYWPNDGLSYPSFFFHQYPPFSLYLTILQHAIVNLNGDVISGDVKVVPYTCSHDNLPTIPQEYLSSVIYTEVFVVTQYWGTMYFHRLVEMLPRLAPYIDFLKRHPSIFIHVSEEAGRTAEIIDVLGLDKERLVSGVIRAKLVYLPQGTPCGFPHLAAMQVFSHLFHHHIQHKLPNEIFKKVEKMAAKQQPYNNLYQNPPAANTSHQQKVSSTFRNRLVLIQRSGSRRFLHATQISKSLQDFSQQHHLDFFLFGDQPSPDLPSTMAIFHSALIIVAPHGAGLANTIFAQVNMLLC